MVLSATHLAFSQQPGGAVAGAAISPAVTVDVLDASNQRDTTDSSSVTLAIAANPGGGVLGGTTTVPVSGGVATFGDLTVNQPGAGYTLTATDGSLADDTSAGFDVASVTSVNAGGLEFLASGAFTSSGSTETSNGLVQVGFTPQSGNAFVPLVAINGQVTVDTSALSFSIDGTVSTLIDGSSTTLFTGTYSLDITSLLDAGVSGLAGSNVTVADTTFTLDSLAFSPTGPSGGPAIELQGSIALPIGLTVAVDGPNHVIIDGTGISLTGLDATLNGSFSFDGLTFSASGLTLAYASGTFTMTGTAGVALLGSSSVTADFGNAGSAPGLVITDGSVTTLDVSVSGNFSALGLAVVAKDLQMQLDTTAQVYRFSGTVSVSTSAQKDGSTSFNALDGVSATLGTQQGMQDNLPDGLVVSNGSVTELNLVLNGSLNLFGLGLSFQQLAVAYDSTTSDLVISGGASLSFGPFGSIAVAVPHNGLTIDTATGMVHVAGLSIAFSVGLGGGESSQFSFGGMLIFTDTGTGANEVESYTASGDIETGRGKFTAGMMFTHSGGETTLDSVMVNYNKGTSQGVPIEGLYITSLVASVSNIGKSTLTISGSISVTYGPSVDGDSFFSAMGNATWTESSLTGGLSYTLLTGIGGSGSAHMDLDWTTQNYTMEMNGSVFDGVFTFDLNFALLKTGELTLGGTADVSIPASFPSWVSTFLGGSDLGSLGFYFQYIPNNDADSFGQAWVTIAGQDVGIKVNFNGDVTETLGNGIARTIQDIAHDATLVYDETAQALANAYNATVSAIGSGITATVDQLASYEQTVASDATNVFNSAVAGAQSVYNGVAQDATNVYNSAVSAAASFFNSDATSNGIAVAQQDYQAALNSAQATFTQAIAVAGTAYNSAVSFATSAYQSTSSVIINAANTLVVSANAALTSLASNVAGEFTSLASAASSALGSLENTAEDAIQAIQNAAQAAANAVENAADDVGSWFSSWGYLSGSTVFFDTSRTGVLLPGQPSTITTDDGKFRPTLPADASKGELVAIGGIDISTGLPNTAVTTAPGDARIVSPLTSLVSRVMRHYPGMPAVVASVIVDRALGIPTSLNLDTDDLIKHALAGDEASARAFAAEVKVASLVYVLQGVLGGPSGAPGAADLSQYAFDSLASAIIAARGAPLNLSGVADVQDLITRAANAAKVTLNAGSVSGSAVIFAALVRHIDALPVSGSASFLTHLVKAQVVAEGTIAPMLKRLAAGQADASTLVAELTGSALDSRIAAATIGTLSPNGHARPTLQTIGPVQTLSLFGPPHLPVRFRLGGHHPKAHHRGNGSGHRQPVSAGHPVHGRRHAVVVVNHAGGQGHNPRS